MTNKEALEASIAHHELNAEAASPAEVKLGMQHCALCQQRTASPNHVDCDGCPVALFTGLPGCDATPYDDVAEAYMSWEVESIEGDDGDIEAAKAAFRVAERKEAGFLRRVMRETPEDILRVTP